MQGIYVTQQIHYIIPAPVLLILGWIYFFFFKGKVNIRGYMYTNHHVTDTY